MEQDASCTKIYEGQMLDVWEDLKYVHLDFGSCTLRFDKGSWKNLKADFQRVLHEAPAPGDKGNTCRSEF